eukprot:4252264-Pleurochrysis_carterae.AAC.1
MVLEASLVVVVVLVMVLVALATLLPLAACRVCLRSSPRWLSLPQRRFARSRRPCARASRRRCLP